MLRNRLLLLLGFLFLSLFFERLNLSLQHLGLCSLDLILCICLRLCFGSCLGLSDGDLVLLFVLFNLLLQGLAKLLTDHKFRLGLSACVLEILDFSVQLLDGFLILFQLGLEQSFLFFNEANAHDFLLCLRARLSYLVLQCHDVLEELLLLIEHDLEILVLLLTRRLELFVLVAGTLELTEPCLQLLVLEHERLDTVLLYRLRLSFAFLDHGRHLLEITNELLILRSLLLNLLFKRFFLALGIEDAILQFDVLGADGLLVALSERVILRLKRLDLHLELLDHGLIERTVADEAATALALPELLDFVGQIKIILFQLVNVLSCHGQLSLKILSSILAVVDG